MSKRQLAAAVAARTGLLRTLRALRQHRGLLVLAYHRIGRPEECPTDEALFSATPSVLEHQVALLRRWSRIVGLAEVEDRYRAGKPFAEPLVLLTFDDVYRDNYTQVFPILQRAGVPGVFFCATGLIERRHVPWWDRIAYAVKHAQREELRLRYPEEQVFADARQNAPAVVKALLARFKSDETLDKERFVQAVEEAAGASARNAPELGELFCTWGELREMTAGGMTIAAHTHTHGILSHLPLERQREELAVSKAILQEKLGVETRSLAYPVGTRGTYNEDTRRALKETGYALGFSHYNGWNPRPGDPYNVLRSRIDPGITSDLLHGMVALPRVFA